MRRCLAADEDAGEEDDDAAEDDLEGGDDPSIHSGIVPFGAEGVVAVLFATDRHDPAIRQLHELFKPRSAELPPQVPSRRSPSVDRTTGAGRGV